MVTDKLNHVDYHWFVVRTRPRQEMMVAGLLEKYKAKAGNILEVYAPTHTTVSVRHDGGERQAPLFWGIVFVLATQSALADFMEAHSLGDILQYVRKDGNGGKARPRTIPEDQMRAFKDFNENYADRMIILERPYSDYAFNPKTNEPNEIVRVIDGPLAGREGYVARFRRDKRLVFRMRGPGKNNFLTVSLPNVWDFHAIRLHNAEGDRLSVGTEKGRAVDLIVGILQACGYGGRSLPKLYDIMERLAVKPSLAGLCKDLGRQGEEALGRRLERMTAGEAGLILNLARYEHDNPGYVRANWSKLTLRPFLTPTSGVEIPEGNDEVCLKHDCFTEIIRRVEIAERVYYPSKNQSEEQSSVYYAHIGILSTPAAEGQGCVCVLFANWDAFLGEYFLTGGKANEKLVRGTVTPIGSNGKESDKGDEKAEKLIESFRNYAPALYDILTDENSSVKAVPGLKVGDDTMNVFAVRSVPGETDAAKDVLINTCVNVCREINATTHLAVWRRYLRTVWLHE